jgi:site-specific recombinase XerD
MVAIGINEEGVARHVARHTFCSWRIQRGYSYAKVGALIADSALMVERVYGHLLPAHLLEASNMALAA